MAKGNGITVSEFLGAVDQLWQKADRDVWFSSTTLLAIYLAYARQHALVQQIPTVCQTFIPSKWQVVFFQAVPQVLALSWSLP
jgi:hypothetical protein